MKLCEKCLVRWKSAAARGGRNGSHADKVRASLAAAQVRAEKAIKLTFKGRTMRVAEWAQALGIPATTIWARLRSHQSIERVLKTRHPVN